MALISFVQALADWARAEPGRPAITDDTRTVTRGELERRTNRLARAYAARGVTQDRFVTIGLPNGAELLEAGARRAPARTIERGDRSARRGHG